MKVPFSKMLVYLDGSEGSMDAYMYAVLLAKAVKASLHVVYVVNTKAVGDLVRSRIFIDKESSEYLEDLRKDASRHIRHSERVARSKGLTIKTAILEGSPHKAVQDYIKNNDIGLLVLGQADEIRSRRDELTSETDRMLRTVACPVLMVRGQEDIWSEFEEI